MKGSFTKNEKNFKVSFIIRNLTQKNKENSYIYGSSSFSKNQLESDVLKNNHKRASINETVNKKKSEIISENEFSEAVLKNIFSKKNQSINKIKDLKKICKTINLKKILCGKQNENYLENRFLFKLFSKKKIKSKFKKDEIFKNAFLFKKSPSTIQQNIIYLQINEIANKYKSSCIIFEKKMKKIKF